MDTNRNNLSANASDSRPLNSSPALAWTPSQKTALTKTLAIIAAGQKAYGKEVSIPDLYGYFELKFQGRHSVEQLIYALSVYTDRKNDIPAPADILAILNPQEPRVTEAQFVEAQKWQERNNWPMISDAQLTIDRYRKQNKEERENFKCENAKLLEMAANSVKRIT